MRRAAGSDSNRSGGSSLRASPSSPTWIVFPESISKRKVVHYRKWRDGGPSVTTTTLSVPPSIAPRVPVRRAALEQP